MFAGDDAVRTLPRLARRAAVLVAIALAILAAPLVLMIAFANAKDRR